VVWGCDDANPLTAGQAASLLPELGVEARGGVLRERCERFLDYYLLAHPRGRPFMHLKLALSADGKIACPGGHSQWLSGPESLGYAHFLRLKYDAALVSYRTVLADNPRLTVRDEQLRAYRRPPDSPRRQPVRIVLDPRFQLPDRLDKLRLGRLEGEFRSQLPRLIIAGDAGFMPAADSCAPGIRLLGLERQGNSPLRFADLAAALWELGVRSVLVEGGGALAAELLRQRLVDKLTLVYTPTLIGADGLGFTPPLACEHLDGCPRLARAEAFSLGRDAVLEGYPAWDQPARP
jgi:diaminohydroxyphosphoribosylaminopyrimidine deaminase/5-amino-6-(5-phosphoribosylamino)uracil reductase